MIFSAAVAVNLAAQAGPAEKPNIVVFPVDDMGLMDTSVPFVGDKKDRPEQHPLKQGDR
jgi:hypothetical protein